jgi:hypothetical protein
MAESRDPRYKASLRRRAAALYKSGHDLDAIARMLGVSKGRAYILCLEGGAKMRPRGPN